jgi:hypothetical protein
MRSLITVLSLQEGKMYASLNFSTHLHAVRVATFGRATIGLWQVGCARCNCMVKSGEAKQHVSKNKQNFCIEKPSIVIIADA